MKCKNCGSTAHESCSVKMPSMGDLAKKTGKMMKGGKKK